MKIFNRLFKRLKPEAYSNDQAIKQVAIFGFADAKEGDDLYTSVVSVTKLLAENGYIIVDGGGPGVMRAATVGAKQVGGKVIGVTFHPEDTTFFEGRDPDNLFDEEIETHSYVERTLALMREGQAYVVFNGGTGTVSELGMAWGLARLYFGHHKPLILYGEFWHNIMQAFEQNLLLRPEEKKVYKIVDSPEGVLQALQDFETELARGEYQYVKATKDNGLVK